MLFTQWTFYKWRQSVCALAQDSSQEQDFPESNLHLRGCRTPEELLRFIEAALAGFSFPLEYLKIREKMLPWKSCSSEVRLL
jgi:hypothetical protein